MSYVRAGTIKAYAVTARTRMAPIPDVPTVDEAGMPGFHVLNWTAYFAPKGTPKAIVEKLNAAVVDALTDPAVVKRAADLGQEFFPRDMQTPDALAAFHKAEIAKWWPVIKAAEHQGGMTGMMTRTIAAVAALLAATLAGGSAAAAQTYPSRPITMIVPFPPGGATDAIARILNERLRTAFGQP